MRVHFENWLKETGQNGRMITPVERAKYSDNRLSALDAVIYAEEERRLVTVRRTITKLQIHDMLQWQEIFGAHYLPCTVWAWKGSDGWIWEYQPIVSDSLGSR